MVLIPKKDNPHITNDFRPISLLNLSLKLLTKLLANRLQKVILSVIHVNQYGFLKGRTIQDCLAWAFQFLHLCHHSKKEIVIVKLDFEKAFDKVEQPVILEMLRHKGFSQKWIHWIDLILSSTSSSVLLNVFQGSLLSAKEVFDGQLYRSESQFTKSSIVPINVEPERMYVLAVVLDCQVGSMPLTYLGLPLGTTRPSVDDFLPLLNIIEKRMMGISSMFTQAGRLIMVNSTLQPCQHFTWGPLKYLSLFCTKQINIENTVSGIEEILIAKKDAQQHGRKLVCPKMGGVLVLLILDYKTQLSC